MLDLQEKVCIPPFAFPTLCLSGRWYQSHFTERESEVLQDDCPAQVVRVVKDRARKLSVEAGVMSVAQADLKAQLLLPQPFQSVAILLLPVPVRSNSWNIAVCLLFFCTCFLILP